ncbi:hypothetical protein LOTGIDRAFT_167072 [Lottia gigantea]|uniref:TIR domain-containing protein n=1 Tax=Lottia gigantea TaxID=225164 RepID=V4BDG3_LOTGI|nr:hypothetical protein LOTGIDRAFT_167072 [Lottia gigantea]ESO86549.1 hypothetical protein LOTGIDRAFT_167072 [Lottia gigantea]
MMNMPQNIVIWMLGFILLVEGQNITTDVPKQELYCPQSCTCGEGSNLPRIYQPFADIRHIYCVWTNDSLNFTEEITMATESDQSTAYDIHIKCYGDTDIVWTSSDFLQKTFAVRMFNCNIINDGLILFPTDSITKIFVLDTLRPADVDKFQFQGFKSATVFQISYSNLNRIPNLPFMPSLLVLTLEGNNITDLSCDLFYKKICLMCIVELSSNSLTSIPNCPSFSSTRFGSPTYNFGNNKLSDISYIGNLDMTRVDLSYNQISHLPNFTKFNLFNLTVSHNSIKEIKRNSFPSNIMLRYLDLSYNQIETIETAAFSNLLNLKELSLNGNNLIIFDSRHLSPTYYVIDVDLRSNQLEYPPFQDGRLPEPPSYLKIRAAENPYICDCTTNELMTQQSVQQIFSDTNLMKCQRPTRLQNQSVVSLNLTDSCPIVRKCPVSCVCDYNRISDITSIVCSNRTLSALPLDLPGGKLNLNLTSNMINILDKRDYFPRIVELDLSYNEISNISSTGLTLLSNILTLDLTNNNITSLPRSITQVPFSSTTQIYVSSNPWLCSCDLLWFAQWLGEKNSSISDKDQLRCNFLSINVIDITEDNFKCNVQLKTYLYYLITILLLIIIFFVFLIIKCRYNAKVLLYTRLRIQYFAPPIVSEKLKENDVFIVYDDEDITWMKYVLLKRLEDIEKPGYKTVIKDRDFLPGLDENENVNDAISNSYCTLFIFSDNFLQNEWCLYNFHCAYEHMLKEKDIKIVIILKDKIDVDKLNDDLKAYFKTHTYLEFNDTIFWDKLLYVLPKNSHIIPHENYIIV